MELHELIECCLATDPHIVPGDYNVILSGSKSGALNSGVLLFTTSPLPKNTVDGIEYRLVSILMLLIDISSHLSEQPNNRDFQIELTSEFSAHVQTRAAQLEAALTDRGIPADLARELVKGRQKLS